MMRRITASLIALGIALGFALVGPAGTAQAVCGSQPLVYNLSGENGHVGYTGSVMLNGWLDNCINYSMAIYPGQNSAQFTDPDYRFDPEFIGTTFCWTVNVRIYYQGQLINNGYAFNWNTPGVTYSGGYAWMDIADSGYRYDIIGLGRTYYSGCTY